MTAYSSQDLAGWEFKIVRRYGMSSFADPANLRAEVEEQARFGWTLLEKFDDNRLRFKRPVSERAKDAERPGDPYKTYAGTSPASMALVAVGVVILIVLGTVGLVILTAPHPPTFR